MNSSFKQHRLTSGLHSIAAIACLALGASNGLAQTTYSVADLGVLPNKTLSTPAAINNQGQVTGTSSSGDSSGDAAFRYDGGSKRELENLGANLRVAPVADLESRFWRCGRRLDLLRPK
jgi:probable HAF family extracellular repeat protein